MNKNAKILIVGGGDVIDQSLFSYLKANGFKNTVSSFDIGLDTTIQVSVYQYFQENRPEYIFLGSVASGGIQANIENSAEFLYKNSESQNNIIYAAHKFQAKKLLYYASSCVYPKTCPQPMKPEQILTGSLEETSESYSLAKLAGIRLCQGYKKQYGFNAIVAIPATVYGEKSDCDFEKAHVVGALVGKFLNAVKNNEDQVVVWGTGNPRREFLHADDFIKASLFLMDHYDGEEIINIGLGCDVSVKELAQMISKEVRFNGKIIFDDSKPDGVKQKLLDNSRLESLGFKTEISLEKGITQFINSLKAGAVS
jgi:GDP-L-fucose synthase